MTIRCAECREPIIEMTKENDWLALWYFLELLLSEGYIEQQTWEVMAQRLETFKPYAMDWDQGKKDDDTSAS